MATAGAALYGALRRSGLPAAIRRLRDQAVVLCFHDIVADGEAGRVGEGPLHMAASRFGDIVEWLSGATRIVPLVELMDRLGAGRSVRGLSVITIDDAYQGFCRHGVPVLERHQAPATLFVVTGFTDRPRPFWWDRLAANGHLDPADRLRCRDDLAGDDDTIQAAYPEAGGRNLPDELFPASWEALRSLPASITLGSHTRSHPNLTRVNPDRLRAEMVASRDALAERIGTAPTAVSYPFGATSASVAAAAKAAGYRAGLALSSGLVRTGGDRYSLPRINIPANVSVDALSCWTSGLRWRPPR